MVNKIIKKNNTGRWTKKAGVRPDVGKCINLVPRMIISFLIYTPMHDSSKLFETSGLTPAFSVQRPVGIFVFYLPLCICYGFITRNQCSCIGVV
jgi:hypothetical protein